MAQPNHVKPAVWFWVIGALALAWNLLGVMAYIGQVTMSADGLAALPEAEQAFLAAAPVWYTGAFAVAVFGGALGSLALLLRKRWALWLFLASLAGVGLQLFYSLVLSGMGAAQDAGSLAMTIMIPLVAGLLIWFSIWAAGRGWLR